MAACETHFGFGGLPRLAKWMPCLSAAIRNRPAFFSASLRAVRQSNGLRESLVGPYG